MPHRVLWDRQRATLEHLGSSEMIRQCQDEKQPIGVRRLEVVEAGRALVQETLRSSCLDK